MAYPANHQKLDRRLQAMTKSINANRNGRAGIGC